MADTFTTKAVVAATVQQVVAQQIQMILNANVVVPGTVLQYPAPAGIDTVKVPRMGKFTVATKVAGTPVDAQANSFTTDDMLLDQHKCIQFLIEDVANLQSNIAVMQEGIKQAGVDLAVAQDAFLIGKLEATSAAAPDHRVAYAGATLAKADLLGARQLLNTQNIPLSDRFLLISPVQEASLLGIAEFVRVDESGGSEALRNGQIGKLFGFLVMLSSQANDARTIAYHRSHVAYGTQMEPKAEFFRDVPNLSDRWSISHLYGAKTMDSGKRGVKLGEAA